MYKIDYMRFRYVTIVLLGHEKMILVDQDWMNMQRTHVQIVRSRTNCLVFLVQRRL